MVELSIIVNSKIKVGLWLSKELYEKFKEFVAEQYGKVGHGLISFEAGQALQHWMSTHKGTQAQLSKTTVNPIPNVFIVKEQVKQYLTEHYGYEQIYKVPKHHIVTAIAALRGTDRRTIKKWLKLFVKWKVMKWITPSVVEFL